MQPAAFAIKKTLICPSCGKDSGDSVDHLLESVKPGQPYKFGPWTCKVCKMGIKGVIRLNQGQTFVDVEAAPLDESHPEIMSLLVIPPQTEPIYLLKRDTGYVRPGEGRDSGLDRHYYFNSHSCPTNWMDNFETIQIGDDADPHGLIRFVRAMHKEDFDKIEDEVREQFGMSNRSSSSSDLDLAIMMKAFPEVAKRFVPTCDDFGENGDDDDAEAFDFVIDQDMPEVDDMPFRPKSYYSDVAYYFDHRGFA